MENIIKKLYDLNCKKYSVIKRTRCRRPRDHIICIAYRWFPHYKNIHITVSFFDKYTIVELVLAGKHYHGLSAKSDSDNENRITGIAIAYNRAFKSMMTIKE